MYIFLSFGIIVGVSIFKSMLEMVAEKTGVFHTTV